MVLKKYKYMPKTYLQTPLPNQIAWSPPIPFYFEISSWYFPNDFELKRETIF